MIILKIQAILISLSLFLIAKSTLGRDKGIFIDSTQFYINAINPKYSDVKPGDTLYLGAGNRKYLCFENFQGESSKPIVIINAKGKVIIDTDNFYGISIHNCSHIKFTGTGDPDQVYGIQITKVSNGAGLGIGSLSSDYEIDHILIANTKYAGLFAKTDPDCSLTSVRGTFTQFNTIIHDNYIVNAGNEGMYIGSTKYPGQTINCNGKDTVLLPSLLDGVRIFNNIIKHSGWDGIQVSSASNKCQVFDNQVLSDSQAEYPGQMSGIILGGGSKCDCYNNIIADGKGDGIENHGLGGNQIFNNIIINAGRTYFPDDKSGPKSKYGIFITDNSAQLDSSFFIQNNTIINPKSDGIRFTSVKSRNNLIASNLIVNPGNFNYYENGNFRAKGVDSYVMLTDLNSEVKLSNNFFSRGLSSAIIDQSYKPQAGSPLIDNGYAGEPKVLFDFNHIVRPQGNGSEIGAFEYQVPTLVPSIKNENLMVKIYPNPAKTNLSVRVQTLSTEDLQMIIYNDMGTTMSSSFFKVEYNDVFEYRLNAKLFRSGVYICVIKQGKEVVNQKFVIER